MERIEPIANVLNNCIEYHIKTIPLPSNITRKPWYLRTHLFGNRSQDWLTQLIRHTSDVFVVAKSLRYPPMSWLENQLVSEGKSCYRSDGRIDPVCARDRTIFITTSALTLQNTRKIVVVMAADMNAQELFRSCSRATEMLYIVDDATTNDIPLKIDERYINDVNKRANGCFENRKKMPIKVKTRDFKVIQLPISSTKIPYKAHSEFVADITGLAIPMIYEYQTTGKIALIDVIKESKKCQRPYLRFIEDADFSNTSNILKLANIYQTIFSGYTSKLYDISNTQYDWLDDDLSNILTNRLKKYLSKESEYEVQIGDFKVDAIDNNIIWEIKCKSRLHSNDIAQLSKYANADGNIRCYRLLNLFTEEILELE